MSPGSPIAPNLPETERLDRNGTYKARTRERFVNDGRAGTSGRGLRQIVKMHARRAVVQHQFPPIEPASLLSTKMLLEIRDLRVLEHEIRSNTLAGQPVDAPVQPYRIERIPTHRGPATVKPQTAAVLNGHDHAIGRRPVTNELADRRILVLGLPDVTRASNDRQVKRPETQRDNGHRDRAGEMRDAPDRDESEGPGPQHDGGPG